MGHVAEQEELVVLRYKSFLITPGFTFHMATVLSFKLKVQYSTWRQISQLCSLKREAKEDSISLSAPAVIVQLITWWLSMNSFLLRIATLVVEHFLALLLSFVAVLSCCFGAVTTFYCPIQPPIHLSENPPKFWTINSQCSYFPMHSFMNFKIQF